jgi:hypothetical protein
MRKTRTVLKPFPPHAYLRRQRVQRLDVAAPQVAPLMPVPSTHREGLRLARDRAK